MYMFFDSRQNKLNGFISFIFEWFTILDLLLIKIIKSVFFKIFVLDFYK